DDPIACLNKAMAFLTAVASSRFSSTNNQLRTSSNPNNQATIQDNRVIVQQVQGRQGQSYSGERHMDRQCTQPKRPRNATWYKDKVMLAEAQEAGQILYEEQLAFLSDPGVPDGQAVQIIIPNNAVFRLRILIVMILTVMISQMQKQFSWLTFPTMALTLSQSESKEKEDKYMENEMDLEKKINELDNILFKVGQSAQTLHMLTKPHAFYDNIHKQALGYQNPFHLKKSQRIKSTLYDGNVMSDKHVAMPVIDDEEFN
ncbi:hypothetical protein Tco_0867866, partial [Tanacetum coccineum]